jgi:hypothetical protein
VSAPVASGWETQNVTRWPTMLDGQMMSEPPDASRHVLIGARPLGTSSTTA